MDSSDINTIRGGYEAFGRGDIPAVLEAFNPDLTWTVPPVDNWGGTFRGTDEVLGFFSQLPVRYGTNWTVEPDEFLDAGSRLVVLGRHRFGDGDIVPFVHVWTTRNGKAATFDEFVDNSALSRHVTSDAVAH